jgi:hypothetical protein
LSFSSPTLRESPHRGLALFLSPPEPNPVQHEGTDNSERSHANPKAVSCRETVIVGEHNARPCQERD